MRWLVVPAGAETNAAPEKGQLDASAYTRDPGGYPGLTSMHDLAGSLLGTLRVTSGRGAGTEVRAVIPALLRRRVYGSELSQVTSAG